MIHSSCWENAYSVYLAPLSGSWTVVDLTGLSCDGGGGGDVLFLQPLLFESDSSLLSCVSMCLDGYYQCDQSTTHIRGVHLWACCSRLQLKVRVYAASNIS